MLPKISSAFLNVTNACNLACRYCFVQQKPDFMTIKTAKDAADFLAKNADNKPASINFFGGEPLLMWEEIVVPLTEYIRGKYDSFSLSMTSNGILLDRKKLEYMKEKNIGLLLSIDGEKATQDYNRPMHDGSGSFKKINVPLILEYYPNMVFRATIIPETCHYTFQNLMFAVNSGYKRVFVTPNTMQEWDNEHRSILEREMRLWSDYEIQAYRDGKQLPEFSTLDKTMRLIPRINAAERTNSRRCTLGCKASGKCGLGSMRYGAIDHAGNIYGCQEIPSSHGKESIFCIGDIYNGVDDARRIKLMEMFDSSESIGDDCAHCLLDKVCDGGCVGHNFLHTGDINRVPEVYCWWNRLILREAIYIMQTLGNENNREFLSYWKRLNRIGGCGCGCN